MTKRRHRYVLDNRRCPHLTKHAYSTRKRALQAAAMSGSARAGRPLNVYKCRGCRKWHLTSREERA